MRSDKKSCITINCGCCENSNDDISPVPVAEDSTPVGTVISYMGTKAPKHYLVCDGAELNITDFPVLAQQIKNEFGMIDYFGGDGTRTFAVPDLRNEFLRGYHGDAMEQFSGDIGKHQDPTCLPYIQAYSANGENTITADYQSPTITNCPLNYDNTLISDVRYYKDIFTNPLTVGTEPGIYAYTARPTNAAVLYCIRYE